MKKIILLLLVMASFNAFSQEPKGVAIDLCLERSHSDSNYLEAKIQIRNNLIHSISLTLNSDFSYFISSKSDTIILDFYQYFFYPDLYGGKIDCSLNKFETKKFIDKTIVKLTKKKPILFINFKIAKNKIVNAKYLQINFVRFNKDKIHSKTFKISEILSCYYCNKKTTGLEKVKIGFTVDKTKSDTNRVYLNMNIENLTNENIDFLAHNEYLRKPEMIFGFPDSIFSDTLHFQLTNSIVYGLDGCSSWREMKITIEYKKDDIYPLALLGKTTIHFVLTRAQFNAIKCIKMKWFDSFAMGKNDEFEERVLYFPLKALENK